MRNLKNNHTGTIARMLRPLRWLCPSLAVIASLALFLSSCGSSAQNAGEAGQTKMTLMCYHKSPICLGMYVAEEKGFFKHNGLNVHITAVDSATTGISATESGSIDVAEASPLTVMPFIAKGIKLRAIMGASGQYFSLVVGHGIRTNATYPGNLHAIKGKRIGVTGFKAESDLLLSLMLADAGMSRNDVHVVDAGGNPGEISLMGNGRVDGVVGNPSVVAITQNKRRAHVLVDFPSGKTGPTQLRGVPDMALWATPSYINDHSDAIKRLRRSLAQADTWINESSNFKDLQRIVAKDVAVPFQSGSPQLASFTQNVQRLTLGYYTSQALAKYKDVLVQYKLISGLDTSNLLAPGTPTSSQAVKQLAQERS